jgi:aspartate racemase
VPSSVTELRVKTIGIIGGIGPETTVIYYRLLIAAGHTPIIINSVDSGALIPAVLRQDTTAMADLLSADVARLAAAGAELGLIAANTPHMCFPAVQARSPIPLVSIVSAVAEHVAGHGWRRVALLGTRMTMEARFYPEELEPRGIEVVTPDGEERTYVHDKYMGELFKGTILAETRRGLLAVIDAMAARAGIDAVILGGTELSLILTEAAHGNVSLVDTTRVHVDAVLARAAAMA